MMMSPGSTAYQVDPLLLWVEQQSQLDPDLLWFEQKSRKMTKRTIGDELHNGVILDKFGKLNRAVPEASQAMERAEHATRSESLAAASIPAVISPTAAVVTSLAAASEPATTLLH